MRVGLWGATADTAYVCQCLAQGKPVLLVRVLEFGGRPCSLLMLRELVRTNRGGERSRASSEHFGFCCCFRRVAGSTFLPVSSISPGAHSNVIVPFCSPFTCKEPSSEMPSTHVNLLIRDECTLFPLPTRFPGRALQATQHVTRKGASSLPNLLRHLLLCGHNPSTVRVT